MKHVFLFLALSFLAAATEFSRDPYVQFATHDSMRVVWRTEVPMNAIVKIGFKPDELNQELSAFQILTRLHPSENGEAPLFKDSSKETQQFEATITGLEPRTTYYYAIFDGDERLTEEDESYHFVTHPEPGSDAATYFWVVGDSGTGGRAQAQVHDAMRSYLAGNGRKLDLYIHVGDMAYGSGTNKEFSDRFFSMYEPTLRNTVCWPSMGNHEGRTSKGASGTGPYYDAYMCPTQGEAGGLASGTEAYYSFDYGKVHFICLDSHDLDRRPSGAMAQWLKADLEKTKAEFLVAFFHHPPYTKGSHDSDNEVQLIEMREHIMPILESGGVDIVFTGHSHIYERSMLIDGAYQTPTIAEGVVLDDGDGNPAGDGAYRKSEGLQPNNGVVQIVTGHGGTGVRRKGISPIMKRIVVENGSCLISIEGDTLFAEMISLNAVVRDTFAITKQGTVTHTRIDNPAKPDLLEPGNKKPSATPVPKNATAVIAKNAKWSYLVGTHPAGRWTAAGFDDSSWKIREAGFGYGDEDDATELDDMRGNYSVVYLRSSFELPENAKLANFGLSVSYDDAFIAYLNGREILRVGVDTKQGAAAKGFTLHEANGKFTYFPLREAAKFFNLDGKNVLSIEGHNANLDSSDFTLHPTLLLAE
ncbi:metallophosphoesterase family protein [Akkermansiaceae bacterium]|nr:metallophosphoesterase family protein [Akkermansiaceae bacterium]